MSAEENTHTLPLLLAQAEHLAVTNQYDREHARVVTHLSLRLFDELSRIHKLPSNARILLHVGAFLHDIGRTGGGEKHNKVGRDIILSTAESTLALSLPDRMVVALIVRYHRGPVPGISDTYYRDLSREQQLCVKKLASFVRIADGFDRSRLGAITDLSCAIYPRSVEIRVVADRYSEMDTMAAQRKADLFEMTFSKDITIVWP